MYSPEDEDVKRGFPVLFFLLFCLFVAAVYAVLFLWIATKMDRLVVDRTRATARQLVDSYMLEYHLNVWENEPEKKDLVRRMTEGLQSRSYHACFLTLGGSNAISSAEVFPPEGREENDILQQLREALKSQREESHREEREIYAFDETAYAVDDFRTLGDEDDLVPVYRDRYVPSKDHRGKMEYQYYQPVYWKRSCNVCHRALGQSNPYMRATAADTPSEDEAFRVVRVSIRDPGIRSSLTVIRARLLVSGFAAYLVTIVGTLLLLIAVGGRRHRRRPTDDLPADVIPTFPAGLGRADKPGTSGRRPENRPS